MSFTLMVHGWNAEVPTQSHRLVLMKLVDCCDDDGKNIFPKIKNVAKAAKCSERHVHRVIGEFCRIGLLRRVKVGGRGQSDASHYEMDLDLLTLLRRTDAWPALMAAAHHQPVDAEDEPHAQDACDEAGEETDGAAVKGDTMSPLEVSSMTPETSKYDKLSHTLNRTPQRPLNEREGAQARANMPASEGEPDASGLPATLEEFCRVYPFAGADDLTLLTSAWQGLPFAERRAAIDGVPGFVAWRKEAGYAKRLPAPKYLSGRNWALVPQKAAEKAAKQVVAAFIEVKGWSRDWWLMLLWRLADGLRQKASYAVQQAEAGKSLSATAGEVAAAAKRIGELKPYLCNGPEIDAWRPWLAERGARIPVLDGTFRVFLPSETPPGGRSDDDADVPF